MNAWPVQDAKARFSELLDACVSEGPQVAARTLKCLTLMRHYSIHSGIKSPANSEEHEDSAIGAFRSLLESDIKSGVHLTSLPDDLAQAMLANLHHAVALDEEIIGEVAL